MKKRMLIYATVATLGILVSCSTSSSNTSKTETSSATKSQTETTKSTTISDTSMTTTTVTTTNEPVTTTTTVTTTKKEPVTTTTTVTTTKKPVTTTKKVTTKEPTTTTKKVTTKKTTTTTKPKTTTTAKKTTTTAKSKSAYERAKFKIKPITPLYKQASMLACIEMVLDYYGYDVTQEELLDYFEVADATFYKGDNGETYGPTTWQYFVGDLNTTKYGGDWGLLKRIVKRYMENISSPKFHLLASEDSPEVIATAMEANVILIVWLWDDPSLYTWNGYLPDIGTIPVEFPKKQRYAVVIGASDSTITVSDPTSGKVIEYTYAEFDKLNKSYTLAFIPN